MAIKKLTRRQRDRAEEKARVNRIIRRATSLKTLLKAFGVQLSGFDPGVSGIVDGGYLSFPGAEWSWLEPLLIELRQRRMLGASYEARTSKKA